MYPGSNGELTAPPPTASNKILVSQNYNVIFPAAMSDNLVSQMPPLENDVLRKGEPVKG